MFSGTASHFAVVGVRAEGNVARQSPNNTAYCFYNLNLHSHIYFYILRRVSGRPMCVSPGLAVICECCMYYLIAPLAQRVLQVNAQNRGRDSPEKKRYKNAGLLHPALNPHAYKFNCPAKHCYQNPYREKPFLHPVLPLLVLR